MKQQEDEIDFRLKLKGNKFLKQGENAFATLSQEGIIYKELLGEGSYAKVISAYYEKLKKDVAVKIMDKRKAPKEYLERFLQREISLICELDHPNIVKLLGIQESNDRIFMVMELCCGGDLLDYVNEKKYETEEEIKKHFKQFASAISYCHQRGIIHRDLKLENIVLDSEGNIKVTDFGFARHSLKCNLVETFCGSFAYASPEVLRGEPYNGYAADIWSMGVILYAMLSYRLPYDENDLRMLSENCLTKKLKFTKDTTIAARDLIQKMLEIDTNVRLTARNVLNHEWLSNAMVYANGNRIQENSCKDSDEICKVDSEPSETSLSSNLSSNYAILKRQTHTNDKGSIIQEEEQFQIVAVRRSTITSVNEGKILANVVRPTNTIKFADTVKKKKVAIMCLGTLGRGKPNERQNDIIEHISGTIKCQDSKGKDKKISNLVSQLVKAKKICESEKDAFMKEEDSDDESIKEMKTELQYLQNESSVNLKNSSSEAEEIQKISKVRKWRKICGKLTRKDD